MSEVEGGRRDRERAGEAGPPRREETWALEERSHWVLEGNPVMVKVMVTHRILGLGLGSRSNLGLGLGPQLEDEVTVPMAAERGICC